MKIRYMNLIIDIGNTKQKLALVKNNRIISIISVPKIEKTILEEIFLEHKIEKAIISNVRNEEQILTLLEIISEHTKVVKFRDLKKFPIINAYQTPESLGTDRLAVAAGSQIYAKGSNVLVIQIGTCITYEFIDKNSVYYGGAISPGTLMRFESLHHFTGKLPLVEYREISNITGKNTQDSILSGVLFGIIFEIDGNIEKYKKSYPDLRIIMTGGGAKYFDKLLKNEIFAIPNLVIIGLNHLLEMHEE